MGATPALLDQMAPPMRDLLRELLLHKSLFANPWFLTLAAHDDAGQMRVFERIAQETLAEGKEASQQLNLWASTHIDPDRTERVARDVRHALLESLIRLKGASTEAFLHAAMNAPTEEIRDNLRRLADMDRRHADEMRIVLGTTPLSAKLAHELHDGGATFGAHERRYLPGTLGQSVKKTLATLRAHGAEPTHLVLSPIALRHLRDEGLVSENTVLGLPAEVELGWGGETFSVMTHERVSLAEILTAQTTGEASAGV